MRPKDPVDKVRSLQRQLFKAAKRHSGRRFHALLDRIYRGDVLMEAWRRVRSNRGAAGVDGESLSAIEARGVEEFLGELREEVRSGEYRPQPVRRVYIPKSDGGQRPLGIPSVRDRVVQAAVKLVLEPIFEAGFSGSSYGFRPRKSAVQAKEAIRLIGGRGHYFVVDADIRSFFDTVDRGVLMERLSRRISDRRVLRLLRLWLESGVMEEGNVRSPLTGTPQGGVISPLLANVYLDALDEEWERSWRHLGHLVRYADDLVVLCRTRAQAEEALRRLQEILGRLRLELHAGKTRVVELGLGKEGFCFLGCYFRVVRSHFSGKRYLFRWPSPRAMNAVRSRIRELTDRRRRSGMRDLREVIRDLNPLLRGWGNYFRTGNASQHFNSIDRYVSERLVRLLLGRRRDLRRRPFHCREWFHGRFVEQFGLHKLLGTIRYPGVVHAT
jgi:group II intron reverse transcriptase/maturase